MAYLNAVEIESALLHLATAYPETAELLLCPNLPHEPHRTHVLRIGTQEVDAAEGVLLLGRAPGRKNHWPRPTSGGCDGADLNRSFDYQWDHVHKLASDSHIQTSAGPCSDVYRGPSPPSEPEARNVLWLLDSHPRIRWHMDVDSAVPIVLYSWGSDQDQITLPDQTFLNSVFGTVRGRPGDTAHREYIAAAHLAVITSVATCVNDAVKAVRGDDYGVEQACGLGTRRGRGLRAPQGFLVVEAVEQGCGRRRRRASCARTSMCIGNDIAEGDS